MKIHYLKDKDSKAHFKGGKVRKCTIRVMRAQRHIQKEVRAQRRTRNVVGLENALPKR